MQIFKRVLWIIAVTFAMVSVSRAQTLYVTDFQSNIVYGYTSNGVQSTFASGFNFWVTGLAFDSASNLFVAVESGAIAGQGQIIKTTPSGAQTTFASGLQGPSGLAFNKDGYLFEADLGSGNIFEFTTNGVRSTFASGLNNPNELAFNIAGDLFVADGGSGNIYKFTTNGSRSTFASGLNNPIGLAFNRAGDLFLAESGSGNIYRYSTNGSQSTFASGVNYPQYIAFNSNGELFVGWGYNYSGGIYKFTTNGIQSTFASGLGDPEGLAFQGLTLPPTPYAPSITTQPSSTTNNIGDTVNFTVGVSNANPVAYQWIKDGINLPYGTNSTLTISNVQPVNIGNYAVSITDIYKNTVTSSSAMLRLNGVNPNLWEGLVAFYPFNGSANDATGNGNNGILNGIGIGSGVDRFGISNGCYHFAGGGYISVSPTPFNVNSNSQPSHRITGMVRLTMFEYTTEPFLPMMSLHYIPVKCPHQFLQSSLNSRAK